MQCACIYGIPRLAIGGSAFRDVLVIFRTQKVFLGEGFQIFDSRVCFFFSNGLTPSPRSVSADPIVSSQN